MAETKNDEELFKSLKKFFQFYQNEARAGNYCIFLPEDILEEKINIEVRKSAINLEEGLRELGKVIYFAVTGTWEYNDSSILIDGYPVIDIYFWPVLQILLSRQEAPSIEMVAKKINEIEDLAEKNTGQAKINKEESVEKLVDMFKNTEKDVFYEIMEEVKNRIYENQPIKPAQEGRDAKIFLDEVFKWIEENIRQDMRKFWPWSYGVEESLVCMQSPGARLKEGKFIDSIEQTKMSLKSDHKGTGIDELTKLLNGKRIMSVLDSKGNWYLKVLQ